MKNKRKINKLCEARSHAIKSKIGHRDHLTVLPNIHILIFAVHALHTAHTRTAQRKREAVMTDDGSEPPIEQLATAVHRGPATRSWWPAAACAARRGCNVLGVLYMLSDVYISGVSFGEETQNIGNIHTVEVLIFNRNDLYISGHSERGFVTHSNGRDSYEV